VNKPTLTGALLVLLALLAACAGQAAPPHDGPPSAPTLPELMPGEWTAFTPGGETICADGSPYTFYVRPGTVNKVVVDFEGGGACWSGATCAASSRTYQPNIASSSSPRYREDSPSGLYDQGNPENPVGDWHHVFISYCTADVHLGDSIEVYETGDGERTINHNGQDNVAAVLGWVEREFSAPEAVLVTGCSAGAYGAALYTPRLAERYPDADVTGLGDCGAGIIPPSFATGEDGLNRWNIGAVLPEGVDLTGGVPATFLADAYVAIGEAYPEVTLAQYNSALDETQVLFYAIQRGLDLSDPEDQLTAFSDWRAGLQTSLEQIRAGLSGGFSSYTSLLDTNDTLQDGTAHCVINRPDFYTLTTDGVLLTEWLGALLNNDAPPAPVIPPTLGV